MNRRDVVRTLALGMGAVAYLPSARLEATPAVESSLKPNLESGRSSDVWACWIGHSTVLLRIADKWVITDPVLFNAYGASFLGITLGPRRYTKPALQLADIPKPDLILISHAHMDHMDRRTLSGLCDLYPGQIDVITAAHTMDVIEDLNWRSRNEMDWGDTANVHGFELTALKVRHNGWRWPGEACRANGQPRTGRSYNGYYIRSSGMGIVFGGDTAYTDEFKKVPGPVHLAMMPIGAYEPYPDTHCTPEECLEMVRMMGAERLMPIHYNTFRQSEEPRHEPKQRLIAALAKNQCTSLACLNTGEYIQLA